MSHQKKHTLLVAPLVIATSLIFVPVIASAQTWVNFLTRFMQLLNMVLPMIIAFTIVFFFWGVVKFIQADESTQKSEAKGLLVYGIVAIFVMVSIWGLVNFLLYTVFENPFADTTIVSTDIPQFPTAP